MAAALQPFGIRVNSVCPGMFPSGLSLNAEGNFHAPMQEAHKVIPKGYVAL
jgi:NAD(P)-dependent dehydrogenase (short-subunit alcohol dehydrogenase family)